MEPPPKDETRRGVRNGDLSKAAAVGGVVVGLGFGDDDGVVVMVVLRWN